jgi:hypothetical protein
MSLRSVPRSDYWTNLSTISEWITLHCVSEIFSATSNPSSQSNRMRSPILNTLMNSLSSMRSPQKSTCTGFFGRETSNSSARRPSVIDQTIPPANRQYLPAVFLHQSSAASGKLLQIPRLFAIFRLHSPNRGLQKDVAPAGICRCSGAIRECGALCRVFRLKARVSIWKCKVPLKRRAETIFRWSAQQFSLAVCESRRFSAIRLKCGWWYRE